jgi:DNA-binding response OmpR family regulator
MNQSILTWQQRAEMYQRRCETLEQQLFEMKQQLFEMKLVIAEPKQFNATFINAFGLTRQESLALDCIMRHDYPTRERIYHACSQDGRINAGMSPNGVDVRIFKIRNKLKKHGIRIETLWGVGYHMSNESKELVRRVAAAYQGQV